MLLTPVLLRRRRSGGNPLAAIIRTALGYYIPSGGTADDGGLSNENGGSAITSKANVLHIPSSAVNYPVGAVADSAIGVTTTPNYSAGPVIGQRTIRAVSTNTIANFYRTVTLPAGTYTYAAEMRAASAVTIKFGKGGGYETSEVIGTSFATHTSTFTSDGSALTLSFSAYVSAAYDIEIANRRISVGSSDLGLDTSSPLLFEFNDADAPPSLPTTSWRADSVVPFAERRTISGAAFVAQVNVGATSPSTGFLFYGAEGAAPLSFGVDGTGMFAYVSGSLGSTTKGFPLGLGASTIAFSAQSDKWIAMRNGFPVHIESRTLTPYDTAHFSMPLKTRIPADWSVGVVAMFDESLSVQDLTKASKQVENVSVQAGVTMGDRDIGYYAIGDSITAGSVSPSISSYASQALASAGYNLGANLGEGGGGIASTQNIVDTWGPYLETAYGYGKKPIVSIMIGVNDGVALMAGPAAYYSTVMETVADLRSRGCVVIMCTLLPTSYYAGWNTARATYNGLLQSGEGTDFDVLCDFSSTTTAQDGSETNLTYFQADELHPTQTGQDELTDVFNEVLGDTIHCVDVDLLSRTRVNASGLNYSAAPWNKVRTTATVGQDGPFASGVAFKLVASTDTNTHVMSSVLDLGLAAGTYYHSFYLKENEYRYLIVQLSFNPTGENIRYGVVIDAQTGTVTDIGSSGDTSGLGLSYKINPSDGGWHRVDILWSMTSAKRVDVSYYMSASGTHSFVPSFTGDGTSGINIYGAA